jgi:hypothetical protein
MNEPAAREGGCLCSAARYVAHGQPLRVNACHCTFCQKVSGAAFLVICVYAQGSVRFDEGALRVHEHVSDESGRRVHVHFCPRCGSSIANGFERFPGVWGLLAGGFDERGWITPERHFYTRSAQGHVRFPPGVDLYERFATRLDGGAEIPWRTT